MSRVAFLADLHIGNFAAHGGKSEGGLNLRGRLTVETFRRALDISRAAAVDAVVLCGDVFHVNRPHPAVVAATQRAIKEAGVQVIILPGNHDMEDATAADGNTACEPLHPLARVVRVPTTLNVGKRIRLVPFSATRRMRDVVLEELQTEGWDALATHIGMVDDSSPGWAQEAKDTIHVRDVTAHLNDRWFFVGNYHRFWQVGHAVQVGVLNPTGHGDGGEFESGVGSLVIWDGTGIERLEVPGPRFLTMRGAEFAPRSRPGNTTFIRHIGDEALPVERVADMAEVQGYEWEPAPVVAAPVVRGGRANTQQPEEALSEYVARMRLEDGVDRAKVLESVQTFWSRAAGMG